jgi:hypothetical protein
VDLERLPAHLGKIIRENFKRDWLRFDVFQDRSGEAFVIGQADLSHQSRIGCQTPDIGLSIKIDDALEICAVCENFHRQIQDALAHSLERNRGSGA